jgi:O-antigen biosynthesis protein
LSNPALALSVATVPHRETYSRLQVRGKFLFDGQNKFYVRGVTYGPFRPSECGTEYPGPAQVSKDFEQMAASGINSVRTYSVPPRWMLDLAQQNGLRLMIGLPWEQHVAFLDEPGRAKDIEKRVRAGVRQCSGHPAVFCYAIGNEIPGGIVRWLGRHRVEQFIERLYHAAKAEDPEALVTYVNFPTTEFLELPFLDLFCFNVYLESQSTFESYLARVQTLVGDRPLLMAEIGLDSRRNGEKAQAFSLEWQVRSVFAEGCAGAFVFSWTDEWHRLGCDIEDWDFGITRRDRSAKLALESVRRVFCEVPFPASMDWPRISVIVCTYNGKRTLRGCFQHLQRLDYPNFEVLVVDDGSTDQGADSATEYGFRLIRTPNSGLSSARNTGLRAATGEIVAYIDDDAYPDPDWLRYLAAAFLRGDYVGVGGPNIPPPGGWVEECVSNSPGGPIHVLLTDREAEHIPGCNMAFRKAALLKIGGFDERFRVAGDDVDVCWSLQKQGGKLGFSPAAVVWHHRRNSIRGYWRQQRGYGRAEALLEEKWPEKYNAAGHVSWAGRVYGNGFFTVLPHAGRIYQGQWGTAPFQRLYQPTPGMFSSLVLMPEWYLFVALLGVLTVLGLSWKPLWLAAPFWLVAVSAPLAHALASGWRAHHTTPPRSRAAALRLQGVTALLHLMQPVARLLGRVRWGLTPWRSFHARTPSVPRSSSCVEWSEEWRSLEDRLVAIESEVKERGIVIRRGGDFDDWDLQIRGGLLGSARLLMTVEEHGQGRQLVRMRLWPQYARPGLALAVPFAGLSLAAGMVGAWVACSLVGVIALLFAWGTVQECEAAMAEIESALRPSVDSELPVNVISFEEADLSGDILPRPRQVSAVGISSIGPVSASSRRTPAKEEPA